MNGHGYLHIISGSMFSGKTTSLMNLYSTSKSSVLVFNHCLDNRYDPNNAYIITHDRARIPCTSIAHIRDVFDHPDFGSVETIMIDEIQFFTGIKRDILEMVEVHGKRVVLAGLLTDVYRNTFGELNELIPVADRYEQQYSECNSCGGKGLFSVKRTTHNKNDVVDVGSSDKYIAVCRYHYLNRNEYI